MIANLPAAAVSESPLRRGIDETKAPLRLHVV